MFNKTEWAYITTWSKKIKGIDILGGKCSCCGEDRPWLLCFHHNDPNEKEFNINDILALRWSIIEPEIKKCVLLCYNCHREIHDNDLDTKYNNNKKIILDIKAVNGCEICGYNKSNHALDFHHNDPNEKEFRLSSIRISKKSFTNIKNKIVDELNKCSVYCANCHMDKHFDKENFDLYKEQIYNYNVKEIQPALDKQMVIDMYNSGMKQHEIRKKLNCAKSTICVIIKKYIGL